MSSTDATPPKFVKKTFTLEIRNTFRLRNFSTIWYYRFSLYAETGVHEQCWVCMACWSLNCEILLLLNMADIWIVSYLEDSGVRDAEYLVHLVCMNRLSAYRECCGVHSWQNGTRCRNGECCGVIPI